MPRIRVDLTAVIRRLLLQIISQQEQITAMRYVLEDAGILTPAVWKSAVTRSKKRWSGIRKSIEAAGTTEETLLLQLLRDFEGPVQ